MGFVGNRKSFSPQPEVDQSESYWIVMVHIVSTSDYRI